MAEPVISREVIAKQAQEAAAAHGPQAPNPYCEFTRPGAHAAWASALDAALKSDVLEGSEA